MSRARKFLGLWIIFLTYVFVIPAMYYLLSKSADTAFGFHRFSLANLYLFGAAFCSLVALFWVTWAYSYLHFVGKGSPVEAFGKSLYPTQYLVTTGPYAYSRNPMVFGLLFILLAIAFAMGSISGLIMVPIWAVIAVLYIKRFEEPELARRFGNRYLEYRKSVPILIPKLSLR